MLRIRKDLAEAQQRLEQLLSRMEGTVRRAFARFIEGATSEATLNQVADLIEAGQIDAAAAVAQSQIIQFASVIPQVFALAATAEAAAFAQQLGDSHIAISFDPTDPQAAALMRQSSLQLIRQFTDSQVQATRNALTQALLDGAGPIDAARSFRDSIGLTDTQLGAVANYRRLLQEGSADALARDLRDRRFDPTVQRAVSGDTVLTSDQIDKMTERYRQRMLMYRSENIARTETLRTVNQARLEATRQMLRQTNIGEDGIERIWRAIADNRTRDTHRLLDGQVVQGTMTPFISPSGAKLMFPGDPTAPAAEVINCRCTVVNRIKPTKVEQAA